MVELLTKRKRLWVGQRKDVDVVRGEPIRPSAPVESRYAQGIDQLVRAMMHDVQHQLTQWDDTPAAEKYFAEDAGITDDVRKRFKALWKRWTKLFDEKVEDLVDVFVDGSNKANSSSVHASLKKLSGGLSLGTRKLDYDSTQVLKAAAAENVALIKSIPQQYLGRVEGAV